MWRNIFSDHRNNKFLLLSSVSQAQTTLFEDNVTIKLETKESMSVYGAWRLGGPAASSAGAVRVGGRSRGAGGRSPSAHASSTRPRATVCSREPRLATRPDHAAVSCPMVSTLSPRPRHTTPYSWSLGIPPSALYCHNSTPTHTFQSPFHDSHSCFYYLFTLFQYGMEKFQISN